MSINNKENAKDDNRLKIILGLIILILILIFGPVIVNFLMSFRIWEVYGDENIWIPSLSTYYGAILGGVISGLLTLFGVRLTINTSTEEVNRTIRDQQKIREDDLKYNSVKEQVHKLYNPIISFQNKIYMKYTHYNFNLFSNEEKNDFIKLISENEIYADANLYQELILFSIALRNGEREKVVKHYRNVIMMTTNDIEIKKQLLGLPNQKLFIDNE